MEWQKFDSFCVILPVICIYDSSHLVLREQYIAIRRANQTATSGFLKGQDFSCWFSDCSLVTHK